MTKEFTISELAQEWGTSVTTVKKRIEKEGIETHFKTVNNREIKAVKLSDDIFHKYIEQGVSNGVQEGFNTSSDVVQTPQSSSANLDTAIDKIFEMQEGFATTLKEVYETHSKQLETTYERAAQAEQKLMLIEDKQKSAEKDIEYYKNEYFKLQQENAELKKENERLKTPWYKRKK